MQTLDDALGYTNTITENRSVTGTIASHTRNGTTVALTGGGRALLPRGEAPQGRLPSVGHVAAFLELEPSAGTSILSMTHPALVAALLSGVVPEIRRGEVRVMQTARLPGVRAKVAVAPTVEKLDAVAAVVGRSAGRVKYLTSTLDGERVDVVAWSSDREQFLRNAFAPASVSDVLIEDGMAVVTVPGHLMSAAVGRGGLNTSLAGRLTGLRVVVVREGADPQEALEQLKSTAVAA